jgi:hypothetical protein
VQALGAPDTWSCEYESAGGRLVVKCGSARAGDGTGQGAAPPGGGACLDSRDVSTVRQGDRRLTSAGSWAHHEGSARAGLA